MTADNGFEVSRLRNLREGMPGDRSGVARGKVASFFFIVSCVSFYSCQASCSSLILARILRAAIY